MAGISSPGPAGIENRSAQTLPQGRRFLPLLFSLLSLLFVFTRYISVAVKIIFSERVELLDKIVFLFLKVGLHFLILYGVRLN